MKKRICAALLILLLLAVCVLQPAEAASITYYGRQALQNMSNGTALVKAYDLVVKGVEAVSGEIIIRQANITVAELEIVMDAYHRDHTEQFWYYHFEATLVGQKIYSVIPIYYLTGTQLETAKTAMEAQIESILSGLDDSMSDYEKELYLHDALGKQVEYAESTHAHNAYGALVEGIAVCEGYAEALQVLLHRAGIRSFIAIGSSKSSGVAHAWNYVQLDGSWYHTDLTWNDQSSGVYHGYFNMSDAMITEDHAINTCSYSLPVCSSADAHYYTVNGASFSAETYTVEEIAALLRATPWTANVYITDDVDTYVQWVQNNINAIYYAIGAPEFEKVGVRTLGREVQLYFTCPHTNLTNHSPKTGTCLDPGNSRYYTCDACGTIFGTDQTTVLDGIPYVYSDHNMVDGFCTYCQVVTSDGAHYPSLEEAAAAGGSYVRLNFDLDGDVSLPCSVYLDLNGKTVSGDLLIPEGATLYLFDSATAGYEATDRGRITGTVTGTVAASCNTPAAYGHNYKYLTMEEQDGSISAHRYYLAVRSAMLFPYQVSEDHTGSAVNYSIVFKCSDFLAAHVTDWGAKLTGDEVLYAEAGAAAGGMNTCVTALTGTLRDDNSEEQNLQNAEKCPVVQGYIRLLDGTELASVGVQKSVKDLVTYACGQELSLGQTRAMQEMYRQFAYVMDRWGLDLSKFQ